MKIKSLLSVLSFFLPIWLFLISPLPTFAAGQGERCQTDNDCNTGTCANNACAGCDQILLICIPRSAEGNDCIRTSDCMEGLECGAGGICVRPSPVAPPAGQEAAPPPVQQLENPLCVGIPEEQCTLPAIIGRVIKALLGIVGSIALLMFIYGGFLWLTAGGNEKNVQKGKDVLVWAVIGLIVIFSSYAILSFIINKLTSAPGA